MSKVIAVKTVSNEEVVATVVEDNDDHFIINKARALVMQQSADGSVSLGMLPFMVSANNPDNTSEADVKLYKKDIMSEVVKMPDDLEKAYLRSVSSIELL